MKINISQIIEGFKNDWFPSKKLRQLITHTSTERLLICINCPYNSSQGSISNTSHCKDCGCFLTKKTKCLSCKCPQGKWDAIVTEDQEEKIDKVLADDNSA